MIVGIDFNSNYLRAYVSEDANSTAEVFVEESNYICIYGDKIFFGANAIDKYLTNKYAKIYSLSDIVELNGIVVGKNQIGVEKWLSLLIVNLLKKSPQFSDTKNIQLTCVALPYDKYYYWHDVIRKAGRLIGLSITRILSQPNAFFAIPHAGSLHIKIINELIAKKQAGYESKCKQYEEKPWYLKPFSLSPTKPTPCSNPAEETNYYMFLSLTNANVNCSLVGYGGVHGHGSAKVLEVVKTEYSSSITEDLFWQSILNFIYDTMNMNGLHVSKDKKTRFRLELELRKVFNEVGPTSSLPLRVPYVLCEDGTYVNIEHDISAASLVSAIDRQINELAQYIINTFEKMSHDTVGDNVKIEHIIFSSDFLKNPFFNSFLKQKLNGYFDDNSINFLNNAMIASGALNNTKLLAGVKKDYLPLEVLPFSICLRAGREYFEAMPKDTIIPHKSNPISISTSVKSGKINLQLVTREGEQYQSLDIWCADTQGNNVFEVTVEVDANMIIRVDAIAMNKSLPIRKINTFSFSGADLNLGYRGKDIQTYIKNQFSYINAVIPTVEPIVFEPDSAFYAAIANGQIYYALNAVCNVLGLKPTPQIELIESKYFDEQGALGFLSGNKISINKNLSNDPYLLAAVMVHELVHYILLREEGILLDDEQENEILTEISTVYLGLGKIMLNGQRNNSLHSNTTAGYLNESIIKYIHEI